MFKFFKYIFSKKPLDFTKIDRAEVPNTGKTMIKLRENHYSVRHSIQIIYDTHMMKTGEHLETIVIPQDEFDLLVKKLSFTENKLIPSQIRITLSHGHTIILPDLRNQGESRDHS